MEPVSMAAKCSFPKGAEALGDYRPISLVGSLYKWLAKVLANRLKKVVGKVVSKAQGAFVEGRQILDAVLIANEAIDSTLKNNESGILCKLDIEKAYDKVDWNFILTIMKKMGFGEKWIRIEDKLGKSELIPVGRVESMDDLAGEFGCSLGSLPTTYLGMPLGAPFKSVIVWDGVEERFRRRLSMWKRQYLSKGGRATLIRSTLSNLPIYLMSLLCLPSSVRRRLEKIQRDFLWGGGNPVHKPHLVRWELVCLSKAKGGLGVKSLSLLNKTLLAKWNWRLANEREALWNQVIREKYGEARREWCSWEVREAHGLGLWKGIRADWKLVSDRMAFIVGNGRRVSFWRDRWCGESPLYMTFPSLFALTVEKEAWVANIWDPLAEGGWGGWNPCFLRAFNDWEVEEAESFMERIQSKRVVEDVEDTVSWTKTKCSKFSVKSLYLALEAGGSSLFPSSVIWNAKVQPKISFFAWEATWGKALTLDLVQKRGWVLANRCFMCLEKEETINHLLLHCSRTRALWDLLFALFGVSWVLPFSVRETLLSWNGFFMGKNRKKVWRVTPLHIFWTVWKERNRLDFKDESVSIKRLKHSFILTLWAEAKLFIDDCPLTIANFIDWLGS
ncbi:putative ribonuclease H protein [Vitis vinifera]|uniref:Putative ribonuclease H protein n=1 Tax=Vitis vinifera TaxID=29760 RepID=A0A438K4C0_VITVI|nr:putative ribonuclease H protein [Vitis vinifera]